MTSAILDAIRTWLAPLNERISNHPYVLDAEQGTPSFDKVRALTAL